MPKFSLNGRAVISNAEQIYLVLAQIGMIKIMCEKKYKDIVTSELNL